MSRFLDDYIEEEKQKSSEFKHMMDKQDLLLPFAVEIIKVRDSARLSQEDFAKQIGVSYDDLVSWEECAELPPLEILNTIADTFNSPIKVILNIEPNKIAN